MTDHYISYLQAELRERSQQITPLWACLEKVTAERDAARSGVEVLTIVLDAVLKAHAGCTPDTCTTMAAIERVTP